MMRKHHLFVAWFAALIVGIGGALAQTIPPLLPGSIAVTGLLQSQYVNAAGELGKIVDWTDIDNIPEGQIRKRKYELTRLDLNDISAVSITLLDAPGEGKAIIPIFALLQLTSSQTSVVPTIKTRIRLSWHTSPTVLWGVFDLVTAISHIPDWTLIEYDRNPSKVVPNKGILLSATNRLPAALTALTVIIYYREVSL